MYQRGSSTKSLAEMADEVEEVNREHGWYDDNRRFGEDIALLHSEVSEALEAYREAGPVGFVRQAWPDNAIRYVLDANYGETEARDLAKPEGVPSELADVLIRLLDTAKRYGADLEAEYEAKMAYNRTRPHKHGGKAL